MDSDTGNSDPEDNPADDPEVPGVASPNVNTLWAGILVDELARCGLREACISPGSRSAPLVFQFAAHPEITDYSIVDERSAAFFALGLARASGRPVALLCTSGTAAANYFPVICEAAQDNVPLLVLTADRPPEDHDCGASQVMQQAGMYGDHVRWHHQVAQPEATPHKLAYLRSLAARTLLRTRFPQPGPVHIDLPFRKPLEPMQVAAEHPDHVSASTLAQADKVVRGRPDGAPWVRIHIPNSVAGDESTGRLAGLINRSRRPLIIAGADSTGSTYREALSILAERAAIPVFAEPASGLRHWGDRGRSIIGAGDLIAGSALYARHGLPDLVIRTGSAPLTWAMQTLLSNCRDAVHLTVGATATLVDLDHVVQEQLITDPAALFFASQRRLTPPDSDRQAWLKTHLHAAGLAVAALDESLQEIPEFSAPRMWHTLGALLPDGCGLYFSSSMLVRHLDTFMCAHDRDLDVYFNRGLNGIDGVVSTASGIAAARGRVARELPSPTVLVIGDVALRHDATALLLAIEMQLDLTVVVVDNDGGEIFEYLPSAGFDEVHQKHFATSGATSVARLVPHGIDLLEPEDWRDFDRLVADSLASGGLRVIRFPTSRRNDHRLRGNIIDRVSMKLDSSDCLNDCLNDSYNACHDSSHDNSPNQNQDDRSDDHSPSSKT